MSRCPYPFRCSEARNDLSNPRTLSFPGTIVGSLALDRKCAFGAIKTRVGAAPRIIIDIIAESLTRLASVVAQALRSHAWSEWRACVSSKRAEELLGTCERVLASDRLTHSWSEWRSFVHRVARLPAKN